MREAGAPSGEQAEARAPLWRERAAKPRVERMLSLGCGAAVANEASVSVEPDARGGGACAKLT